MRSRRGPGRNSDGLKDSKNTNVQESGVNGNLSQGNGHRVEERKEAVPIVKAAKPAVPANGGHPAVNAAVGDGKKSAGEKSSCCTVMQIGSRWSVVDESVGFLYKTIGLWMLPMVEEMLRSAQKEVVTAPQRQPYAIASPARSHTDASQQWQCTNRQR
jgi:hypothetical protein